MRALSDSVARGRSAGGTSCAGGASGDAGRWADMLPSIAVEMWKKEWKQPPPPCKTNGKHASQGVGLWKLFDTPQNTVSSGVDVSGVPYVGCNLHHRCLVPDAQEEI